MLKKTLSVISCLILFASCEKVIEFDIQDSDRYVVVNALPCTDSLFFANITYSRFFLDNQAFPAVTNATVMLDINGTLYGSTSRDGANYLFAYHAAQGDTLTLHVDIPGREAIVGGTRVPYLPDMQAPIAELDTLMPFNTAEITFTLNDPSGRNYYYIFLTERDSGIQWNRFEKKWDTIDTVIHPYFNCVNEEIIAPTVNSTEGFMKYFNGLLFIDSLIDRQSYEVKLSLMMLKDTAEHPLLREYSLVVESLSPEAFRYTKEVLSSQGMGAYFAEPLRIFSNLSGGALGIFAGIARRHYPLTFTYKQPEEVIQSSTCKRSPLR